MRRTFAVVAFVCMLGPVLLDRPAVRAQAPARAGELTVANPTADARPSETVTLTAADVQRVIGEKNLQLIHVRDDRDGDLLTQAIDVNDDGTFDELIFQTNLKARELRLFTIKIGRASCRK